MQYNVRTYKSENAIRGGEKQARVKKDKDVNVEEANEIAKSSCSYYLKALFI